MKLIDADVLPSLFDEEYKKTMKLISEGESHLDNLAEGFTEAHQVILKQPTIEAEPVRHGEWLHLEHMKYRCSACERACYVATIMNEPSFEYCPHCGAKMDGGSEYLIEREY